ncbi:heavy metal translocating P-type ATPase [Leptospira sp. 96542]|nr:heavy metal translocating P-type ATPase [Leptospira sp. 96542]
MDIMWAKRQNMKLIKFHSNLFPKGSSVTEGERDFTLDVFGMTCSNCALRIEKGLTKLDGVKEVRVNFALESIFLKTDNDLKDKEIFEKIESLGYTANIHDQNQFSETESKHKRYEKNLKIRFFLSAILSLPLFYGMITHFEFLHFLPMPNILMERWVQAAIATPVQFLIGFPFYLSAYRALKNGTANMDVLVVLGTTAAYGYSLFGKELYFETSVVLITFILAGKWIEHMAKGKSSDAINSLLKLRPETATVKSADGWTKVPSEYLKLGDHIQVKSGEKFPTDGKILEGMSFADESMLTGESLPVEKKMGDPVMGGTMNGSGSLIIEATKVGKDTTLSSIIKSVEDSLGTKAPLQRIADQISAYFVPFVILISVLDFLVWYFWITPNSVTNAIETSIAILVIACPCALGLATPISLLVGTGLAAKKGILFRSAEALESVAKINLIGFDKTGTLTEGKPRVFATVSSFNKNDAIYRQILEEIVSIEKGSDHPLAKAIVEYGQSLGLSLDNWISSETVSGGGILANWNGRFFVIGKQTFIEEKSGSIHPNLLEEAKKWILSGGTPVFVQISGNVTGTFVFAIEDTIRPNAKKAVDDLFSINVEPVLLTGDTLESAKKVASLLGIPSVHAGLLPTEKSKILEQLKNHKTYTAMIGDGINDAPALASADVGIAMGTGSDIAISTADIVLLKGDIRKIVSLIQIGKDTVRNIRQNFFWALAYNTLGIPIAASGLLAPWVSGAAMAFSSISVVLNALRMGFEGKKKR